MLQGPDFTLHMMNTVLKWFTVHLLYKCQISTWHCQNRKYDIWFRNVYFWWLYVFNSQYFLFSAQNTLCSAQTILQVNLFLMQSRLYFILLFAFVYYLDSCYLFTDDFAPKILSIFVWCTAFDVSNRRYGKHFLVSVNILISLLILLIILSLYG